MNIIFLDINGVLDTNDNIDEIDQGNLKRLKQIIEETNSQIVISSSLKNSYYYTGHYSKHLQNIISEIENAGMIIIGITPKCQTREEEIIMYLGNHPEVDNYCILDDDYEMERLKDHLVKISPQIEDGQKGLEEKYMHQAIKILKRKK